MSFALTWFIAFMTPRFHDYARGLFRAPWEVEFKIAHQCDAIGKPT